MDWWWLARCIEQPWIELGAIAIFVFINQRRRQPRWTVLTQIHLQQSKWVKLYTGVSNCSNHCHFVQTKSNTSKLPGTRVDIHSGLMVTAQVDGSAEQRLHHVDTALEALSNASSRGLSDIRCATWNKFNASQIIVAVAKQNQLYFNFSPIKMFPGR